MANEAKPAQAPTDGAAPATPATPAAPAAAAPATPAAAAAPATGTPPAAPAAGDAGGKGETESKAATPPAEAKAPEKYSLSVPKGAEGYIDGADIAQFEARARSKNLTNEQAQALLEEQADEVVELLTKLETQTKNDPVYGKDHFEANQAAVRKAVERVRPADHPRTQAFNRFLVKYGVGNHPEMFAFLADLGKLMAEDKPASTSAAAAPGAPRDPVSVLYGGN